MALLWFFVIALLVACFKGVLGAWRRSNAETEAVFERHKRNVFKVASEEAEALRELAQRRPQSFRARKPGESIWNYTRELADRGGFGIAPWRPSYGDMRTHDQHSSRTTVSMTLRIEVWTTIIEGVVHRVGKLPLKNGLVSDVAVLVCEPTQYVETSINAHEVGHSPVITCLGCVTKVTN